MPLRRQRTVHNGAAKADAGVNFAAAAAAQQDHGGKLILKQACAGTDASADGAAGPSAPPPSSKGSGGACNVWSSMTAGFGNSPPLFCLELATMCFNLASLIYYDAGESSSSSWGSITAADRKRLRERQLEVCFTRAVVLSQSQRSFSSRIKRQVVGCMSDDGTDTHVLLACSRQEQVQQVSSRFRECLALNIMPPAAVRGGAPVHLLSRHGIMANGSGRYGHDAGRRHTVAVACHATRQHHGPSGLLAGAAGVFLSLHHSRILE